MNEDMDLLFWACEEGLKLTKKSNSVLEVRRGDLYVMIELQPEYNMVNFWNDYLNPVLISMRNAK